jgi:hypothetical protein
LASPGHLLGARIVFVVLASADPVPKRLSLVNDVIKSVAKLKAVSAIVDILHLPEHACIRKLLSERV